MTTMSKVALIVRTKNRPLFIKRALFNSIMPQTYKDYRVYVINDGGNSDELQEIEASLPAEFAEKIVFVHLPFSLGRGGALSAGISHTSEKYLHIHDDGDTLEPEFLQKTVSYLEDDTKHLFSGVKTSHYDVYEHIDGNEIVIESVTDHFGLEIASVKDYISVMSHMSVIMPITILFRRDVIKKTGSADPRKYFGEETDLFTRLMQNGEIGVIKDYLCSYHHRKNSPHFYENSTTETSCDQSIRERNALIREALNTGDAAKLFQANVWRSFNVSQVQLRPVFEQIRVLKQNLDLVTKNIKSILEQ